MSRYNLATIEKECVRVAGNYNLTLDTPIKLNGRLRTTLGRVVYKGTNSNYVAESIEFNKTYLENAEDRDVLDTIRHEMAHWIVYKLYGCGHNHDIYWKRIAAEIGANPTATYDAGSSDEAKKAGIRVAESKYTLYCSCCNKIVGTRTRKCKVIENPRMYQSNCCKASILVKEN